jgi:putative hydroxymethylpyrimidine transport system substrate-binding protein
MNRSRPALAAVAVLAVLALAMAGCGRKDEPAAGDPAPAPERMRVVLDYFPNADHAGLYLAQANGEYERAGLDVEFQAPSDPAAPLGLLQAGRADLAISYQPELLLARDQGADLVSIGALVQAPLTSLISVGRDPVRDPEDLRGKTVGTAGIPYQSAYLQSILEDADVDPQTVREINVGFNLTPAMLSGRVDATLGSFWNYEGVDLRRRGRNPQVLRMEELGVPTYNELIVVARREDLTEEGSGRMRRFMLATTRGHEALRQEPDSGVPPLLDADRGLERGLQREVIRATLPVFFPDDEQRPFGWQDPAAWTRYGDWMLDRGLVRQRPVTADAMTNELLPGQGLATPTD